MYATTLLEFENCMYCILPSKRLWALGNHAKINRVWALTFVHGKLHVFVCNACTCTCTSINIKWGGGGLTRR